MTESKPRTDSPEKPNHCQRQDNDNDNTRTIHNIGPNRPNKERQEVAKLHRSSKTILTNCVHRMGGAVMETLNGHKMPEHTGTLYMTYIVSCYELSVESAVFAGLLISCELLWGVDLAASRNKATATEWTQNFPSDQESKQLQRFSRSGPSLRPAP